MTAAADTLREAADRLDALADPAMRVADDWLISLGVVHEDAAYIAAMSPEVGKALAELLHAVADVWTQCGNFQRTTALAVARAILGGDS